MPRAKRALPSWASDKFPQPKMGSGLKHKYIEVPKKKSGKSGVTRPTPWTPEDVLKNYGK